MEEEGRAPPGKLFPGPSEGPSASFAAVPVATLLLILLPTSLPGQEAGWNSERVDALLDRAVERRDRVSGDSALDSYRAEARGYVYFFADREDTEERVLVKVDQVALDIYWKAPDLTKQEIVGLRDEKKLPTNIRYHLDHLTVVQDDFGKLIRVGDGDEIRGVLHPVSGPGRLHYDYRLTDSLTISLPGAPEPVRVYEVEVRPRDHDQAGFVGSVFLDRRTAAIVRMRFTFTPASYVDPRLDYIRITLDNGLWLGRYWLPHEQRVEIRRELRYLDFPVGGVIRGRMRIGNYDFDVRLPRGLFAAGEVTARPREVREEFPFEEGLHADLEEEGLEPTPELAEIRSRAAEIVRDRVLSGIGGIRLYEPDGSHAFRFNRAEGAFAGLGLAWTPLPRLRTDVHAGWAFGAEKLEVEAGIGHVGGSSRTRLAALRDVPRDIGPVPGSSGAINTLSSLFFGDDHLDLYRVTGARLTHRRGDPEGWTLTGRGWLEEHRSMRRVETDAPLGGDDAFDPVLPVAEGREGGVEAELRQSYDREGLALSVTGSVARFDPDVAIGDDAVFGRVLASAERKWRWFESGRELAAELRGGVAVGDVPVQRLFLLGGRETLPGYGYRSFSGDRFWLARVTGSLPLLDPWLRLRGFVSAGEAETGTADSVVHPAGAPWALRPTGGVRPSAGLGLGLGFDIFRFDVARGLDAGEWETIFEVNHRFWGWL